VFKQTHLVIILVVFVKTTCYVAFTKTTSPKTGNPAVTPSSILLWRKAGEMGQSLSLSLFPGRQVPEEKDSKMGGSKPSDSPVLPQGGQRLFE